MNEIRVLFPGSVMEFKGYDAFIYPIAFGQIRKFSDTISLAVRTISGRIKIDPAKTNDEEEMKKVGLQVISALAPMAMNELMDLFKDCVIIKDKEGTEIEKGIEFIPHWEVAPIITKWIEESFVGQEKVRPWIEAMRSLISQIKTLDLSSLSGTLSNVSSPQDIK